MNIGSIHEGFFYCNSSIRNHFQAFARHHVGSINEEIIQRHVGAYFVEIDRQVAELRKIFSPTELRNHKMELSNQFYSALKSSVKIELQIIKKSINNKSTSKLCWQSNRHLACEILMEIGHGIIGIIK